MVVNNLLKVITRKQSWWDWNLYTVLYELPVIVFRPLVMT